jgi:hypothetical protein
MATIKRLSPAHAVLLAVGLFVLLVVPPFVHAQGEDPPALVRGWVDALNARNYDAALTLMSDSGFLIYVTTPEGNATTYEGKGQIRQALQGYGDDNTHIEVVGQPYVENGTLIWTEQLSSTSLRSLGISSVLVTANAITEGGMFKSILYEPTPGSALALSQAVSNARNKHVNIDPVSPIGGLIGISTAGTTGGGITGMPRAGREIAMPLWFTAAGLLLLLAGLALRLGTRTPEVQSPPDRGVRYPHSPHVRGS